MPRGDGTGPMGTGALMGSARGGCGRGWRKGFCMTGLPGWMRFGGYNDPYRHAMPYSQSDPVIEKQVLTNQASILQSELDRIRKRLEEMGEMAITK